MSEERRGAILIASSFPPRVCGVGDYTARLAHELSAAGAPVAVWTRQGETAAAPGVHPILSGWDRAGIRDLVRRLRVAHPRVVHLQYERAVFDHSPAVSVLLPELLRALGVPLVTTFHALDGPQGWGRAHRAALLPLLVHSRSIVVSSPRQQRAIARLPGIARKTYLLPVGASIEPQSPPAQHRPARDGGPLGLVYFGFLWPGRNVEMLLRTLAALPVGAATLEVIGGVRDAAYRTELERIAGSLKIADRVTFHGELPAPEVSRRLTDADAMLLPFATGASVGRSTLAAALAHGLPVVTTAHPENLSPEFRDGENLLLAPVGDEAAFAANVRRVVEDAALRARLRTGAARLSEELFAWPKIAAGTLRLPGYAPVFRDMVIMGLKPQMLELLEKHFGSSNG